MGNREDLLAGAKHCLYEKGYGRTTARDIATAAGVSLAAIGYHFGSKEALLNAAMMEATKEWGEAVDAAVLAAAEAAVTPEERFVATWRRVGETFVEYRGLWAAQCEAIAQIDRTPELRQVLAGAQRMARLALAAMFQGQREVPDSEEEYALGTFYQALLAGYAIQWLLDPEQAPTGELFLEGLQLASARVLGRPVEVPE
ncbi:TetR family transcriptional regulator [Kitasatospora sp. MMS16-BH015]|uniref:TetR/AcrR family transcriptional regulator n=1 Tax=Kitasatospora sp. MMS16-BH015 TaxID=2018025 RepID=UPI000CA21C12|nr:TetR/AcrR family transcriptional regulator [Kitasatospora sp. MMS16-BH015]AUG78157.1 TetR family transcriptional regulator [Kitasatospora sp. MMS16-BH015]